MKLERTLYRSLLRLASNFDDLPVLRALICRKHGSPLPPVLDDVVAQFLRGNYYWPVSHAQQRSVLEAVRLAFRQPAPDAALEDAFAGVRYLSGLLAVARKHKLLGDAPGVQGLPAAASSAAADDPQQQQQRPYGSRGRVVPEEAVQQGMLLVAHPCLMGSIFSRSVVLLCRHDEQGSYGLILNKPLGSSLANLQENMRQLHSGLGGVLGGGERGSSLGAGGDGIAGGVGGAMSSAAAAAGRDSRTLASWPGDASGDEAADSDSDIPAQQLQRLMELDWKPVDQQDVEVREAVQRVQEEGDSDSRLEAEEAAVHDALRHAVALAQLQRQREERARSEYDEHGNWIEVPYQTESEEEVEVEMEDVDDDDDDEGEEEEEVGTAGMRGSGSDANEAGSVGVSVLGGAAGQPTDLASLLHALQRGQQLQGDRLASAQEQEPSVELVTPDRATSGVVFGLDRALQEAGGGLALLLDAEGKLFMSRLHPGEHGEQNVEAGAGGREKEDEAQADGRWGMADSATPVKGTSSRLKGERQAKPAAHQEEQHQAVEQERRQQQPGVADAAEGSSGAEPACQADLAADIGGKGAVAAAAKPTKAAAATTRSPNAACSSSSASSSAPAPASKAQRFLSEVQRLIANASSLLPLAGQQRMQLLLVERPEGGRGAGSLGGLFGTGSGRSSSSSSGSGDGGTLGELMTLFAGSPLFRGGPVPGVQVLHRRPRLGGALVLGPEGAEDGVLVGADLRRAKGLAEEGYLRAEDVRVCMGEAVWAPGQLDEEVESGTWEVVSTTPAVLDLFGPGAAQASSLEANMRDIAAALENEDEAGEGRNNTAQAYEGDMWSNCLRALGGEYAELARVPPGLWSDLADLEV